MTAEEVSNFARHVVRPLTTTGDVPHVAHHAIGTMLRSAHHQRLNNNQVLHRVTCCGAFRPCCACSSRAPQRGHRGSCSAGGLLPEWQSTSLTQVDGLGVASSKMLLPETDALSSPREPTGACDSDARELGTTLGLWEEKCYFRHSSQAFSSAACRGYETPAFTLPNSAKKFVRIQGKAGSAEKRLSCRSQRKHICISRGAQSRCRHDSAAACMWHRGAHRCRCGAVQ